MSDPLRQMAMDRLDRMNVGVGSDDYRPQDTNILRRIVQAIQDYGSDTLAINAGHGMQQANVNPVVQAAAHAGMQGLGASPLAMEEFGQTPAGRSATDSMTSALGDFGSAAALGLVKGATPVMAGGAYERGFNAAELGLQNAGDRMVLGLARQTRAPAVRQAALNQLDRMSVSGTRPEGGNQFAMNEWKNGMDRSINLMRQRAEIEPLVQSQSQRSLLEKARAQSVKGGTKVINDRSGMVVTQQDPMSKFESAFGEGGSPPSTEARAAAMDRVMKWIEREQAMNQTKTLPGVQEFKGPATGR